MRRPGSGWVASEQSHTYAVSTTPQRVMFGFASWLARLRSANSEAAPQTNEPWGSPFAQRSSQSQDRAASAAPGHDASVPTVAKGQRFAQTVLWLLDGLVRRDIGPLRSPESRPPEAIGLAFVAAVPLRDCRRSTPSLLGRAQSTIRSSVQSLEGVGHSVENNVQRGGYICLSSARIPTNWS
jgi:hypothetical protein